jgi:hypothetical protein
MRRTVIVNICIFFCWLDFAEKRKLNLLRKIWKCKIIPKIQVQIPTATTTTKGVFFGPYSSNRTRTVLKFCINHCQAGVEGSRTVDRAQLIASQLIAHSWSHTIDSRSYLSRVQLIAHNWRQSGQKGWSPNFPKFNWVYYVVNHNFVFILSSLTCLWI